jgi:hypothetical protein
MRYFIFTLLFFCQTFLGTGASAAPAITPLATFLEQSISQYTQILDDAPPADEPYCRDTAETWFYRRFTLGIYPSVAFTAGIAQIAIIPEIVLTWERPLPPGTTPYKPD